MTENRNPQLTVFTGTKAMFIKLVPVALEFERRGWDYRIIDTGQHAELVGHIIEQFGLRRPDISLDPGQKGVSTLIHGMKWSMKLLSLLFRGKKRLKRDLFEGKDGICFVHGDTMSTLLSCLIAKRAGQRVAHVEAGLRSRNYLHPFPEEMVRVLVMRMADILFAPSPAAYRNLEDMGLAGKSCLLPGNTNMDTMAVTLARAKPDLPQLPQVYCLATVHRVETLYSRERLSSVVGTILEAHRRAPVVLIQHPPTVKRLAAYELERPLQKAGVTLLPLLDHARFLGIMRGARFVLTDGGSIQEEASYLGVPCLLLRKTTERDEGLGENVVLSGLDTDVIRNFLEDTEKFRRPERIGVSESPSRAIADFIEAFHRGEQGRFTAETQSTRRRA